MEYNGIYEEFGEPFTGRKKKKVVEFLKKSDLDYDEQIEFTVNLVNQDGEIAATGSLHENVLKCIAVDEKYQGEGLSATLVTLLMNQAMAKGREHLFLFTKPKNLMMFSGLGFYKIIQTPDILLMENTRDGIRKYVSSLSAPQTEGTIGAIVANCNPFTNGHRYLMEQAASQCDLLHVFILSEDKSLFPAKVRYELAQKGTEDIPNIVLHPSSDYLISSAVFPTYFIKDKAHAKDANCELDIAIFCQYFAKELHITKRFVGDEPFCQITGSYNQAMKKLLPQNGIELVEIHRKEQDHQPISASAVRECMLRGDMEKIQELVPAATYSYISSAEGKELARKLAEQKGMTHE